MTRLEENLRTRLKAAGETSSIARVSDDPDVREWLVFGRVAMYFCLWAAMILPILLIISIRF